VLIIVTVALSRIIVGAHFPSDILAAVTISITWFYFTLMTLATVVKKKDILYMMRWYIHHKT